MTTHQNDLSLGAPEADTTPKTWSKPLVTDPGLDWEEPKLQRLAGREALTGANTNNDGNATNFS